MRQGAGLLIAIAIPLIGLGILYASLSLLLPEAIGIILILVGAVLLAVAASPSRRALG